MILSEVKRCGDILKKLSKREIVDDIYVSNIALEDLLFEIKNSFEEISKKNIELYLNKKNKKTPIKRSPELTYGIRNFVGNAVKFSKNKVSINLINEKDEIKIKIVDDGPGFPNDVFKIIGEPYIASKSKKFKTKAGLGLGTFIGKTLLERKKANIEFSNSENGGATVEITWKPSDLVSKVN